MQNETKEFFNFYTKIIIAAVIAIILLIFIPQGEAMDVLSIFPNGVEKSGIKKGNNEVHDPKVRAEALRLFNQGSSVYSINIELGVNKSTIHNWIRLERDKKGYQ